MDEATETRAADFWTRMRRRKVVQWGVAYAAGEWGFLQGLAYVSTLLHWPGQLQRLAGLALLIGLPVALVIAWYHGDRGDRRVKGTELAIITLLLLLGGGIFWRYQQTAETSAPAGTAATASTAGPSPSATTDPRPSIAVLPFESRSRLEDDAFFVDGIHDDILTQLSKVSALRVISRTSVQQFRDTKLPMKAVAEQLGVTKILQGGVQRAGDRVRVTVQLIDATTDAHLWAENYDLELSAANIFAIQSDVAAAIAAALRATLTASEKARVDAVPTQNLHAWEAYQLGKQRLAKRTSSGLIEAEKLFRRALKLDPKFALAYCGLADSLSLRVSDTDAPMEATLQQAQTAVDRALKLDPELADAWASSALIASYREQFVPAEEMFRRAALLGLSSIHALRGQKAEALAALREAERAGCRIFWRYYRDLDPNLASIRDEPEFKAVFDDIERDMVRQRAEFAARPKDAPLEGEAVGT